MLASTDQIAAAYAGVRGRVTDVLRRHGGPGDQPVPACPGWTVKDLAAHLCGTCEDILAGRLEGVATDPWTAAQVERAAPLSLAEILDRWDELGPRVEEAVPAFPPGPTSQLVFDVTTHEHDLRHALGRPGARDSDAILVGLGFVLSTVEAAIRAKGLPSLAIDADDHHWLLGDGPAAARLRTSVFELFRTFGGRRTREEFLAAGWEGDGAPYLFLLADPSPLRPAEASLHE